MAKEAEEDEFEMQLRQEELERQAKREGETLSKGLTYVDEDGTVMEWDPERRAYFPKIDADFIAQYQINYGSCVNTSSGQELTEEEQKRQQDEYWQNYYNVYHQQQPALPELDEEGQPVEDESRPAKAQPKTKAQNSTDQSQKAAADSAEVAPFDPTSEEHYQYNLYYYGQEYADAYRDYYREHPDAEAMPDFIAENAPEASKKGKQDKAEKKAKKNKAEKRKEPPKEEGWFDVDANSSTQLYVTGLPSDITEDEYKDIMTKCGLIMFDPLTHKPKLKLYKDEEGNYKGDGLCTYIKPESVQLALQIIDGMELRGQHIKVEPAKFQMKGDFDPKKKKKKLSNKAKQRLKERQQKLFDWRPDKNPFQRAKHERIVILKNMFDPTEFDKNPALINELRADVREECLKFGEVKKVNLYDRNPEGVMSVTFKEPEEADACIAALDGRWFAQRRILAACHDGKTKYDVVETEEERAKRLKDWELFLEGRQQQEQQQQEQQQQEQQQQEQQQQEQQQQERQQEVAERSTDAGLVLAPDEDDDSGAAAASASDEGDNGAAS